MKPIVDVIIPVYNYGDKIGRAIVSVQSQKLTNFACYLVDDGSTDNSKEMILEAIEGDPRFHYIYQENAGVANARNKGVFSGNGKYICCLDADDAIHPDFLMVCVQALENDPTLGIAYTGLYYIKPDGEEGLSQWPGDYDFGEQMAGKNQIPTCNVSRRVMWERLGGQRQRYAPGGAGEEDAEFWLRAGNYGFGGKKVSNKGLFIYSWMSGRVSGNRQHRQTDFTAMHPWTRDGVVSFMAELAPKRISHPVHQYDEGLISVVIPVGPGHDQYLIDALDSLESQTFRSWEAVVVWDNDAPFDHIKTSYPYAKIVLPPKRNVGAGVARNLGAKVAKFPLLLFLDADDVLYEPNALMKMLTVWNENKGSIIYPDYAGKFYSDKNSIQNHTGQVINFDDKTGVAISRNVAKDYKCELAQKQPNREMYIWCLVTALVPKAYHEEIGGFDEKMESWEDWDYFIRLAKAGKCFVRVPEMLVLYRFYSGTRREDGIRLHKDLIKYMQDKYAKETDMACSSCPGGNRSAPQITLTAQAPMAAQQTAPIDDKLVMVVYTSGNIGQHKVVGPATGINYGYRGGGERFLVHRADIALMPNLFEEIKQEAAIPFVEEVAMPEPPADPPKYRPLEDDTEWDVVHEEKPKRGRKKKEVVEVLDDEETFPE